MEPFSIIDAPKPKSNRPGSSLTGSTAEASPRDCNHMYIYFLPTSLESIGS